MHAPRALRLASAYALLLSLAAGPAGAQNLLANPGFEESSAPDGGFATTPSVPGWDSPKHAVQINRGHDSTVPYEGAQTLEVDASSCARQFVRTLAGNYELRFRVSPRPGSSPETDLEVRFAGGLVDVITVPASGAMDWQEHVYQVNGTGGWDELAFSSATPGDIGVQLDACSLVGAAPAEPPVTRGELLYPSKVSAANNPHLPLRSGDQFSRDMALLGDLDGDGVVDLAVGAQGDDDGGDRSGAVWILFMNSDGSVKGSQKISALAGGFTGSLGTRRFFGNSLDGIGDLDLDGVPDLAVGARGDNGSHDGAVYVLFLRPDGTVRDHAIIDDSSPGVSDSREFGCAVDSLGDVDGDGIQDLAVGRRYDASIYVCFMNRDGSVRDSVRLKDGENGLSGTSLPWVFLDDFGEAIGGLGDVDGDGVPDLCVGYPHTHDRYGAAYVIFLNPDGTAKDWTLIDYRTYPELDQLLVPTFFHGTDTRFFGYGVCATGDVDGDGVPDVAVGGSYDGNGGGRTGAVAILLLRPDGTPKRGIRIANNTPGMGSLLDPGDEFGQGLCPLGDFDGDGQLDLAIGCRFDDDGANGAGAFYLCYLNDGTREPIAPNFSGTPRNGAAPLSVAFRDLTTGDYDQLRWIFGDGEDLVGPPGDVTHVYEQPGRYTVRLQGSGPSGFNVRVKSRYIRVTGWATPVADLSADPASGAAPLSVAFTDESFGEVTSWSWDFGDGGTSSEEAPVHVYTAPGTYDVVLAVSGPGGSDQVTSTDLVTVHAAGPPTAAFDATPTAGMAPLAVAFTDTSTGAVDAWSWDFGDGGASSVQHPQHVYASAGTFSVSLMATGPGGADTLVRTDLIAVTAPPAPVAAFQGAPLSGVAPLAVDFSDLSSGATSWSWDFGDGSVSSVQHPTHVYADAGSYTVSLAVTGPGGADATSAVDYVVVQEPPSPGLADASFEGQPAEGALGAPWTVLGGTGHLAHASGVDGAFPSEGAQWAMLSAEGTAGSSPPTNPGGSGDPPLGGAGLSQLFAFPDGLPRLEFEAAFLRAGAADSAAENDWMSVDVTDGTTTWNVFHADTFTPTPDFSAVHGLPLSAVETVRVDLPVLFPGATPATPLTLTIQVGEGATGGDPSRGYVDDFRFVAPGLAPYGCGLNPANSLTMLEGMPSIGTTLVLGVDNPFGTQPVGSSPVVSFAFAPDPAYPCGTVVANRGMSALGADGELLIRISPPPFKTRTGPAWQGPGIPAAVRLRIPNNASLIGRRIYAQGRMLDPGGPIEIGYTNALEFDVGP